MGKKKTHEQYVDEIAKINPNIEVIEKYIGALTKIKHRCIVDGCVWLAEPNNILNGRGCPECSRRAKRKTHCQYIKEVSEINSNIEVIGTYIDAITKILHKCKIDKYEWSATPNDILSGNGCPKCAGNMKKSCNEYIEDVALINPDIEVIEEYITNKTPILHRCKIDGYEWKIRPNDVLSGKGCPVCAKNMLKTHEQYVKEVSLVNKNIEVIGKYIDAKTKILHRCKIDGYEWYILPGNVLSGNGCHICNGGVKITHEQYVEKVALANRNVEVVGVYINNSTPILHRCKVYGHEWTAIPYNILAGCGCPKCNMSHGEYNIESYLLEHNINYIWQYKFDDCCNKHSLPFDFYLPDYNVAIEYQGIQHYEPIEYFGGEKKLKYVQKNDSIKAKYCRDNNIILLQIKYDDDMYQVLNTYFNNQDKMEVAL